MTLCMYATMLIEGCNMLVRCSLFSFLWSGVCFLFTTFCVVVVVHSAQKLVVKKQ
jgi:hypothetical protein